MSEETPKKSRGAYNGYTEARKQANKKYLSKLVNINLMVEPERREDIKKHASSMNESMSAFINRAINETIVRDQKKVTDN